eukprot:SAG22_NODE_1099_length_5564_cov_27.088564_7_plen_54_part_00
MERGDYESAGAIQRHWIRQSCNSSRWLVDVLNRNSSGGIILAQHPNSYNMTYI